MNTAQNSQPVTRVFWSDALFACALFAGPLVWLLLYLVGVPRSSGAIDIAVLFRLVLLMPVIEEIVFRGGVQVWLLDRKPIARRYFGISLANILTSLVFASLHLINQPPLWAALVFIPSLLFGWARDRFNSTLPSIILHCVYNAGFVLLFVEMAS